MAALPPGEKRRWALAAGAAVVVCAGAAALFRAPRATSGDSRPAGPKREVALISAQDTAVNDEAVLLDPTPLFLPTKWNATQRTIASREAGGKFLGFDTPKWTFQENDLKLGLPSPIAVPAGIAEAVAAEGGSVPLVGLGRAREDVGGMGSRKGFLNVVTAQSGRSVLRTGLAEGPPVAGAWQPLEFVAAVDAAGLVGPLVLTVRSGIDEVDSFFAGYLPRVLRLGEQLPPGFYRIVIGP